MNATSNCPYGECDGSGNSIIEVDGETYVRECKCKKQMIQARRLRFANIPKEFKELTINSFDTELYKTEKNRDRAKLAKKAAANFIKKFDTFKEMGKGLYFYSIVKGSGKTRLAASLGNALINVNNVQVKFTTTIDLISEIKSTYNKESKYTESQLIESITNVEVLILDDFGVEKQTEWVNEVLYSIIDHRMTKKKITIFTSNLLIEELKNDERIKNRIEKMAVPIYLPDESIRSKLAKKENEELTEILFG